SIIDTLVVPYTKGNSRSFEDSVILIPPYDYRIAKRVSNEKVPITSSETTGNSFDFSCSGCFECVEIEANRLNSCGNCIRSSELIEVYLRSNLYNEKSEPTGSSNSLPDELLNQAIGVT